MDHWVIVALILTFSLIGVWVFLFTITRQPACPSRIRPIYYECENNSDCYYNPLYECISQEPDCFINQDLTTKEEASRLLTCECVNGECVTKAIIK